jgi:drug/metabolite transporter (DMT)-like permease
MKMSHRLDSSDTAGPVWGLIFGLLMTAIGMGLWFYATLSIDSGRQDESLAVAATLVGLFLAVYAGRELRRKRR